MGGEPAPSRSRTTPAAADCPGPQGRRSSRAQHAGCPAPGGTTGVMGGIGPGAQLAALSMRARRLAARWVLPIEGAADRARRAADRQPTAGSRRSGPDAQVPRPAACAGEDFGDALLLPGLINTHTHLELTGFDGQVHEPDFAAWIRRLRQLKDDPQRPTRLRGRGAPRARRLLGGAASPPSPTPATRGRSIQALAGAGGSGIAYQEVFGPHPDRRRRRVLAALRRPGERVGPVGGRAGAHRRLAPRALHRERAALRRGRRAGPASEGLPLAVHLAESPAESRAAGERDRSLRRRLARRAGSRCRRRSGRTPVEWLDEHGVLTERTLCIHAVQAGRGGRRAAGPARLPPWRTARCPTRRTATATAPLAGAAGRGPSGGLGTDSVVSVGPPRPAGGSARRARAWRVSTPTRPLAALHPRRRRARSGSRARSAACDREVGRLRRDPAGRPGRAGTPAERALASGPRDVLRTCVGGRDVHRASRA